MFKRFRFFWEGDTFRQVNWIEHVRERFAVLLAPWAVYPDIREYHEEGKLPWQAR